MMNPFTRVTVDPDTGCWLFNGSREVYGYGVIRINKKRVKAHRLAYALSRNTAVPPPAMKVCHRCDNPPCINPEHLFLGTQLDNVRDRHIKGRSARQQGESHPSAKLTDRDVRDIRELSRYLRIRDIAQIYGVGWTTIQTVTSRTHWKHVE